MQFNFLTVDMTPSNGKRATGIRAVTATGKTSVTQYTAMMRRTKAQRIAWEEFARTLTCFLTILTWDFKYLKISYFSFFHWNKEGFENLTRITMKKLSKFKIRKKLYFFLSEHHALMNPKKEMHWMNSFTYNWVSLLGQVNIKKRVCKSAGSEKSAPNNTACNGSSFQRFYQDCRESSFSSSMSSFEKESSEMTGTEFLSTLSFFCTDC